MHVEIIIVPVLAYAIYSLIKTISDNRIRRILIEKGDLDKAPSLFQYPQETKRNSSLRLGIVSTAVGLAIVVGQFLPPEINDMAMMGLIFLFAGIGFITYYWMVKENENSTN